MISSLLVRKRINDSTTNLNEIRGSNRMKILHIDHMRQKFSGAFNLNLNLEVFIQSPTILA